jgi:hypothetical protein
VAGHPGQLRQACGESPRLNTCAAQKSAPVDAYPSASARIVGGPTASLTESRTNHGRGHLKTDVRWKPGPLSARRAPGVLPQVFDERLERRRDVPPIQKVHQAYERMVKSDVEYRFSIDMGISQACVVPRGVARSSKGRPNPCPRPPCQGLR